MRDLRHFRFRQIKRLQKRKRLRGILPRRIRAEQNLFSAVRADDPPALLPADEFPDKGGIQQDRRADQLPLDIVPHAPSAEMRRNQVAARCFGHGMRDALRCGINRRRQTDIRAGVNHHQHP